MVISIINQKGGVGKSTLAINLATGFKHKGLRVAIVDADAQATCVYWRNISDGNVGIPVFGMTDSIAEIEHLNFDVIIIDTRANADSDMIKFVKASSVCLIPVVPAAQDYASTLTAVGIVKGWQKVNPALVGAMILNRNRAHTRVAQSVVEAMKSSDSELSGFPIFDGLSDLEAYKDAFMNGCTVFDDRSYQRASLEVEKLVDDIMDLTIKHNAID